MPLFPFFSHTFPCVRPLNGSKPFSITDLNTSAVPSQ